MITSQTNFDNGKWRPFVQGKFEISVPYYWDVIGYLFVQQTSTVINNRLVTSEEC